MKIDSIEKKTIELLESVPFPDIVYEIRSMYNEDVVEELIQFIGLLSNLCQKKIPNKLPSKINDFDNMIDRRLIDALNNSSKNNDQLFLKLLESSYCILTKYYSRDGYIKSFSL